MEVLAEAVNVTAFASRNMEGERDPNTNVSISTISRSAEIEMASDELRSKETIASGLELSELTLPGVTGRFRPMATVAIFPLVP